ncbi:MAG: hypothetical protein U9N84_04010 [Actinomycetota bacterium]|nr:hypothetical protein [Actinomycetota bacterium]
MVVATDTLWEDLSFWSEPAEQAFARARRQANREARMDRRRGRRSTLVSFDEIESIAGLLPESMERYQIVPLSQIVGSVGKSDLFTRSFLPKSGRLRRRWKRAFAVAHGLRGYQPVELYDADGRLYVVDGHFRVSVAGALGTETIQARVRRWV